MKKLLRRRELFFYPKLNKYFIIHAYESFYKLGGTTIQEINPIYFFTKFDTIKMHL